MPGKARQGPVPVRFEPLERDDPVILEFDNGAELIPAIGKQVDVLQQPIVVFAADARGRDHAIGIRFQPGKELRGRLPGRANCVQQLRIVSGRFGKHGGEVRVPIAQVPCRKQCEIAWNCVHVGQVDPGLGKEIRQCVQDRAYPGRFVVREHPPRFVIRRHATKFAEKIDNVAVGTGIAEPGPRDPMAELKAIHLGADQVVVDLFGDGPVRWIDGAQACLEPAQGNRFRLDHRWIDDRQGAVVVAAGPGHLTKRLKQFHEFRVTFRIGGACRPETE